MATKKKQNTKDVEQKASPRKRTPSAKAAEAKEVKVQQANTYSTARFPTVGIGAFAGGLEAFKAFFETILMNPGMSFILMAPPYPTHSNMLPTIIQKKTTMKVQQVEDNLEIVPDYVYVIPPNQKISIINRTLQLLKLSKLSRPELLIGIFF